MKASCPQCKQSLILSAGSITGDCFTCPLCKAECSYAEATRVANDVAGTDREDGISTASDTSNLSVRLHSFQPVDLREFDCDDEGFTDEETIFLEIDGALEEVAVDSAEVGELTEKIVEELPDILAADSDDVVVKASEVSEVINQAEENLHTNAIGTTSNTEKADDIEPFVMKELDGVDKDQFLDFEWEDIQVDAKLDALTVQGSGLASGPVESSELNACHPGTSECPPQTNVPEKDAMEIDEFVVKEEEPVADFITLDVIAGDKLDEGMTEAPLVKGLRRSGKGPLAMVSEIALGGILAVLLSQLMFWWVIGRDPIGLAKNLPDLLSFLAPAKLRDGGQEFLGGMESRPLESIDLRTAFADAVDNSGLLETAELFPVENVMVNKFQAETNDSRAGKALLTEPEIPSNFPIDNTESNVPVEERGFDVVEEDFFGEDNESVLGTDEELPLGSIWKINVPRYSTIEIESSLAAVEKRFVEFEEAMRNPSINVRAAAKDFYIASCQLGKHVSFTEAIELEPVVERLREFFRRQVREIETLKSLGANASGWLDWSQRNNDGIYIMGLVKNVQSGGSLHTATLQLTGKSNRMVTVLTEEDPHTSERIPLNKDSFVLLLGSIVDDAPAAIADYEGVDFQVIWGGFAVPLR